MKFLLIIILLCCIGACDESSPQKLDKSDIEDILSDIEANFSKGNEIALLKNYHDDFLHNSDILSNEQVVWQERLNRYADLTISELSIEIDGDHATANFKISYTGIHGNEIFLEPEDHGDMSYYIKDYGVWYIWGNRKYN